MIKIAKAPKPDEMLSVTMLSVVEYDDIPLALELVTDEGKRIGVPIRQPALFGLSSSLRDAVAVLSKSDTRPTE